VTLIVTERAGREASDQAPAALNGDPPKLHRTTPRLYILDILPGSEIEAEMFSKREGGEKQGELWIKSASVQAEEPGFLQQAKRTLGADGFCAAGLGVVCASFLRREPGRTTWD
jgi:hypothetical protein